MKIRFLINYFFIFLFFLKSSLFCIDKIRWKAQTIYTTEEVEAPFKRVVEKLKIISEMQSGDYDNLVKVFDKYFGDHVRLYKSPYQLLGK